MLAKKALASISSSREFRKELQYLYARRTAVDALIESLQEYDRFRPKSALMTQKRKSA
jgi:hypothetical protein